MAGIHVIDRARKEAWLFDEEQQEEAGADQALVLKLTVAPIMYVKPIVFMIDNRMRVLAGNQNDTVMAVDVITRLDCLAFDSKKRGRSRITSKPVTVEQRPGRFCSVSWGNAGRGRSLLADPNKDREFGAEDDGKRVGADQPQGQLRPARQVCRIPMAGRLPSFHLRVRQRPTRGSVSSPRPSACSCSCCAGMPTKRWRCHQARTPGPSMRPRSFPGIACAKISQSSGSRRRWRRCFTTAENPGQRERASQSPCVVSRCRLNATSSACSYHQLPTGTHLDGFVMISITSSLCSYHPMLRIRSPLQKWGARRSITGFRRYNL